jgi:hypothetical protein
MDRNRRNFLKSLVFLPAMSRIANATKPKFQANPKQNIIKLTYLSNMGFTLASIGITLPNGEKKTRDILCTETTDLKKDLKKDIKTILKDLKKEYPNHIFIFEKSTMDYNGDEYDQLAENTLENLLKPSGESRREYGKSISKPS